MQAMTRIAAMLATVVSLTAFALTVAPVGVQAAAAQTRAGASEIPWYWSQAYAQKTLLSNGLDWSNKGHDSIAGVKCAGLGTWIAQAGTAMFRDFHCYVKPRGGAAYKIIFHVASQSTYRYSSAGWQAKQTWWWPAQLAANTLVQTGIQWSSGLDQIVASSCSAFGPSTRVNGSLYYKLFFCTVTPAAGYSYSIVLDATDKTRAADYFVRYTDQLPVTPANTTQVPSSSNTLAQQATIMRNWGDQTALQVVQNMYKSSSQTLWGSDTGPSGCTWPLCSGW
jgi:hypothetical protein